MRTNVPGKLLKIVDDIDERGDANLTRLTVLKKWFDRPQRLSAFALWVASRAVSRKGKTSKITAELFREARAVLADLNSPAPKSDRETVRKLHNRLRDFQNKYDHQRWGPVRIIHNWNLMLIEHALEIWLRYPDHPELGYKLAADYCQNYDSRYGNGLNGPSRTKIEEIVRFMFTVEALENDD